MFSLVRKVLVALLALMSMQAFEVGARGQVEKQKEDPPVKLKATLVQVPVIVKGGGGMYVTDLRPEEFVIYEDGIKQRLEFFGSVDEPFSVVLALDSSGSTSDQLGEIKAAANAFIENLRPHDRVMVLSFNDSVEVHCNLTNNRAELRDAIGAIRVGEYTQVYEAIYTAVWEKLDGVEGRKAVIVFTDGIDTASSEITKDDTLDAVVESEDVIVYPIRYSTRADVERRLVSRRINVTGGGELLASNVSVDKLRELDRLYRSADEYLHELAERSGGKVERADTIRDLRSAFAKIADELRHQYLLGYYTSDDQKQDSVRRIKVEVLRPGAKVRARPGFRSAS
jgi:Ca-activated chloride channel family protein